jgi:hypothetical protein
MGVAVGLNFRAICSYGVNGKSILLTRSTLVAVLICVGCGKNENLATVTGKFVRADGSPLVGARIVARSKEGGKTVYSYTDGEGRFELAPPGGAEGILPGSYEIGILEDRGDGEDILPATIAKKYANGSTSGIGFTATVGEPVELTAELEAP